jgi:hypothetical protein
MIAANLISNSMRRILKKVICAMLGLAAIQHASGFSIFGPAETFQTPILDYITRYYYGNDTELGGPKNFGEGSRLNVPIITYGYDSTFVDYFGSQGVAAVDSAMAEMNSLPSANSAQLSKFLTQDNQAINYTAQALALTDIKSTVMSIMLEHMGLIGETHVWDLRARVAQPNTTCEFEYAVINRNYDPVTYNPSAYVNGVQYGYTIWDGCANGVSVADAIEQSVDQTSPAQFSYTAVATRYGQQLGGYYLGITRDDMGGLSYLYRSANYSYEALDADSIAQPSSSGWVAVNPLGANNAITGFEGLLGGVGKITFVKVAYNSLLGATFTPLTYNYAIPFVTNGMLQKIRVSRTITQPDILFTAGDLVGPPETFPLTYNAYDRTITYVNNNAVNLGADAVTASVIGAQEIITFNNVNPVWINLNPAFLDSTATALYPVLLWASFNGTTNAPVVFPNGSSIESIEQQVLAGGATVPLGLWNPLSSLINSSTNAADDGAAP